MAKSFLNATQKRPTFGRRGVRRAGDGAALEEREKSEKRTMSFRRVRLRALGVEVSLFYEERFDEPTPQFRVRRDADGMYLSVGDPTGLLLKPAPEAATDEAGLSFRDGSQARDVSLAIGETPAFEQLAHPCDALALRATDIAVDMLVGHSIEMVERQLVLRTLRSFKGDYRQTALALGVSIDELSKRLSAMLFPAPLTFVPEGD
jgi:hypothetical protein